MMRYEELLLAELFAKADEGYRTFIKRLLKNEKINVIGVRMPTLRKIAKARKGEFEAILACSNRYYEINLLKCLIAGMLPFDAFTKFVDCLVSLLDNWAVVDSFTAPCIAKHRTEFLPFIERFFADGSEFAVRYALVTLLHYYLDEQFLPRIFAYLRTCSMEQYYVSMAAAWLVAEVLVKFYDEGVRFLEEGSLDCATRRRAVRKACESFRLSAEQKVAIKRFR